MAGALAVDLGSSRTRVMTMSKTLLLDEPTLAAVEIGSGRLVSFGDRAALQRGRSAGEVAIVRPVRRGQLQDLALTDQICRLLLRRARDAGQGRPDVLCCVPAAATSVQRRALERSFKEAGAKRIEFLEHAIACGMGARLRLDEPVASMVVDVGAATTDVAVMALGGVVTEASIAVGGSDFDAAVRLLLERSFDLVIDRETAEVVKCTIGTAWQSTEEKVEVHGRSSANGEPRTVVLSRSEVATAMAEHVESVVRACVGCITSAPPDLANDLLSRGLHLAGRGGLLDGFSKRLAAAAGIPVHLVESPGLAAVTGAARCLKVLSEL